MKYAIVLCAIAVLAAAGCGSSEVSRADSQAFQKEFSQENYEKAMHAAGKDAELQKEKESASRRGGQ